MIGEGLTSQQGLPAAEIAALVLCAIAGYALTAMGHGHAHAHVHDNEHGHTELHA